MIVIENHLNINVLRDDLLPGGTKSILMPFLIDNVSNYVYASPVFGGLQVALSEYCHNRVTIFCAKRKQMHENTQRCVNAGSNIIEIYPGYLSVLEKRSSEYCDLNGYKKINFGAKSNESIDILSLRVKDVIKKLGKEPEEIFCACGGR